MLSLHLVRHIRLHNKGGAAAATAVRTRSMAYKRHLYKGPSVFGNFTLLGDQTGCSTGNGEKLSSTQALPPQAIRSAVFSFPPFPVQHPVKSPNTV